MLLLSWFITLFIECWLVDDGNMKWGACDWGCWKECEAAWKSCCCCCCCGWYCCWWWLSDGCKSLSKLIELAGWCMTCELNWLVLAVFALWWKSAVWNRLFRLFWPLTGACGWWWAAKDAADTDGDTACLFVVAAAAFGEVELYNARIELMSKPVFWGACGCWTPLLGLCVTAALAMSNSSLKLMLGTWWLRRDSSKFSKKFVANVLLSCASGCLTALVGAGS